MAARAEMKCGLLRPMYWLGKFGLVVNFSVFFLEFCYQSDGLLVPHEFFNIKSVILELISILMSEN
jgi:hypothetical protein